MIILKSERISGEEREFLVFSFEKLGKKEVSLFLDNEIKRIRKDMIIFSEGFEGPIIVDLSNVRFVASLFLDALVILKKTNPDIFLCNLCSDIKEVFTITKLNKLFLIFESVEDALEKN